MADINGRNRNYSRLRHHAKVHSFARLVLTEASLTEEQTHTTMRIGVRRSRRLGFLARWVATPVLSADELGTLLVSRLLLSLLIAHDALIMAARGLGLRRWHALLAAMFAALILHTFQIIFPGHRDQTLSCRRMALNVFHAAS